MKVDRFLFGNANMAKTYERSLSTIIAQGKSRDSSALTPCVITTDIIPFPFSDHDLITLKIDLHNQPRGEGYWHFNNSLLDDNVFVTEIYQFWTDWLTRKNEFNTPLHWWDTAKTYFKNIAVKRSTQIRKGRRHACRQLENKIQRLQEKLANGDRTTSEAYLQAKIVATLPS